MPLCYSIIASFWIHQHLTFDTFGDDVIVMKIGELNLASTTGELELLITSVLSSDITLFEKISISTYRLRITSVMEDCEVHESDSEDFGGVDDDSKDSSEYDSAVDSDCDSGASSLPKLNQRNRCKDRKNMLTVYNEIDESHPGEAWVLGLMEGEYSELNIEEKLDALVALIDLLSAGSSIRMEVIYLIAHCFMVFVY